MILETPLGRLRPALTGLLFLAIAAAGCGGPATPPTPVPVGVGQKTELEKVALTVNSVNRVNQIGESSTPGTGNVFVVVAVTIQNGTDHKIGYSRYQFTAVDPAGRVYEPATVPGLDSPLLTSELGAQRDASGAIAFRVPPDSSPLTLRYQVPGQRNPLLVDLG